MGLLGALRPVLSAGSVGREGLARSGGPTCPPWLVNVGQSGARCRHFSPFGTGGHHVHQHWAGPPAGHLARFREAGGGRGLDACLCSEH